MEPLLFAGAGETLRFVPASRGFLRRMRLVNGLLGSWSIVFGSGSWLEAHLVTRLGVASRQPNLRGCGISEQEVWDLVQQERRRDRAQAGLVVLCDSISGDQGRALMHRLWGLRQPPRIILLVQDDRWLTPDILADCQAQAIVHQQSFGSGVVIRALQGLRRGHPYVDPRIQERLQQGGAVSLSGREQQVLEGLARGWTNKQIAEEIEIAATTVRDYVGTLCRKLDAANRTEAVSRAMALGVLPGPA
jgi:DNA-binding NarL/FixJ family response regulator